MSATETHLGTPDAAEDKSTKESLQWFQSKYDKWKSSPWKKTPRRRKLTASSRKLDSPACPPNSEPRGAASHHLAASPGNQPQQSTQIPSQAHHFDDKEFNANPFTNTPISSLIFQQAPAQQHEVSLSQPDPTSFGQKQPQHPNHRQRLIEFYEKYNPSKVDMVDATLANYKGKEDVLFQKLEQKYVTGKDGILPPSGEGPLCYLNFEEAGKPIGRVVVKLFQDKAPLACENFRCLCTGERGQGRMGKLCFQNSKIHRIVPNFCVQGGDFTKGDGTGGESIYPPNSEHGDMWGKFKDETPFMQHSRKGLLSMANNGPNRNGSQFFFTLRAIPNLDGKHVVFGEVVEGLEVVDHLGTVETNAKQHPLEPVIILSCGELGSDGKPKEIQSAKSTTNPMLATGAGPQAAAPISSGASPFGGMQQSLFGSGIANATTTPFKVLSMRSAEPVPATAPSFAFGQGTKSSGSFSLGASSTGGTQNPFTCFSSGSTPTLGASTVAASTNLSNPFITTMSSKSSSTAKQPNSFGLASMQTMASASPLASTTDGVATDSKHLVEQRKTNAARNMSVGSSQSTSSNDGSESSGPFVDVNTLPKNQGKTKEPSVAFGEGLKLAGFKPPAHTEATQPDQSPAGSPLLNSSKGSNAMDHANVPIQPQILGNTPLLTSDNHASNSCASSSAVYTALEDMTTNPEEVSPPVQISFSTSLSYTPGTGETIASQSSVPGLCQLPEQPAVSIVKSKSTSSSSPNQIAGLDGRANSIQIAARSRDTAELTGLGIQELQCYDAAAIADIHGGPRDDGGVKSSHQPFEDLQPSSSRFSSTDGVINTRHQMMDETGLLQSASTPNLDRKTDRTTGAMASFITPNLPPMKSADDSTSFFFKVLTSPNVKLKRRFQTLSGPSTCAGKEISQFVEHRKRMSCDPLFLRICHETGIRTMGEAYVFNADQSWHVIPLQGSTTSKQLKSKFAVLQAKWSVLREFKTRPFSPGREDAWYKQNQTDPLFIPLGMKFTTSGSPRRRVRFEDHGTKTVGTTTKTQSKHVNEVDPLLLMDQRLVESMNLR